MEFSHELALALYQSTEPFPADFEEAWRWIGYSTKQKAKDKLLNNFEAEVDYIVSLNQTVKRTGRGGQNREDIHLSIDCLKSFGMMAGTQKGKEIRRYFLKCEQVAQKAAEIIPALAHENERMKLELQLLRAKQKYQDTGYAIQLSTSSAVLAWLRGETLPPPKVEYRERFIDAATKKEIGSSSGRSLTQLIADAGLNPKSTKHRQKVKHILKNCGFDYDQQQGWVRASYLNNYPVLEDNTYEQALRAVLAEIADEGAEANLFVHHLQQSALTGQSQPQALQLEGVDC